MSTSTTKLGLVKPVPTEGYDIAIPNANMDKVDQFATELTTGVSKFTKGAFDNTTTPVLASGQLAWDLANQTLRIATINGSEIQVGQEIVVPAVNRTGIAIPNGTLVQLDGADSILPLMKIKPAVANGTVDAHLILGLATHTIADGTMGHVTFFGEVGAVNTTGSPVGETWAVGDVLFASSTTPGNLTKVTPVAPNLKVVVGTVEVANVNGKILVRLNGGSELGATDSNVQFTALVDKDLLMYNAATGVWENKAGGPIVASLISGAAAKATPVDADMVGLMDSAAPTVLKKLSWANIKATLKTYFDGLYNMVTVENVLTSISTTNALSANQGKVLNDGKMDKSGGFFTGNITVGTNDSTAWNAITLQRLVTTVRAMGIGIGASGHGAFELRDNTSVTARMELNPSGITWGPGVVQTSKIYGTHNVTISTTAPVSLLTEGHIHMTY